MITFTESKLFDFYCHSCKQQWSIKNFDHDIQDALVCPMCGHEQPLQDSRVVTDILDKIFS